MDFESELRISQQQLNEIRKYYHEHPDTTPIKAFEDLNKINRDITLEQIRYVISSDLMPKEH
jgi:hypothetical protein